MFAWAQQQVQAEVQLGRPWRFEAVLVAVLLAHEKRMEEMVGRLEELKIPLRS
jgi:hypothetical protein